MTSRLTGLLLLIIGIAFLISCKKDSEEIPEVVVPGAPSLQVTANGSAGLEALSLNIGDTLKLGAVVTAPAGIESFMANYVHEESEIAIDTYQSDTVLMSYIMPAFQLYIDYTLAEHVFTFQFQMTDTLNREVVDTLILTINTSPVIEHISDTVSVYNDLTFGNLFNVVDTVSYFPLNVKTNTTKQASVDFIFAYDLIAKYMMMSPDNEVADTIWNDRVSFNWPFTKINKTRFVRLDATQVDYEGIVTGAQLEDLMKGTEVSILTELQVGEIIAFRLSPERGSRAGILKITKIYGNGTNPRRIIFDLKLEN